MTNTTVIHTVQKRGQGTENRISRIPRCYDKHKSGHRRRVNQKDKTSDDHLEKAQTILAQKCGIKTAEDPNVQRID